MTRREHVLLTEDAARVDWREVEQLFELTDLRGRRGDKIRRAFLNSDVVCFAYEADRLVALGRAITDGEYHACIYDLAVHPHYQRSGVGRQLLEHLRSKLSVWRVMLVADVDVQRFYRRFGFDNYPDVMARVDRLRLYDPS